MKQFFTTLLVFIFPLLLHAQTFGSVSIKFIDSREIESSIYWPSDKDTQVLYKINNGVVTGRALNFTYTDSAFVSNLDTGLYHFSYRNMFGQDIDKLISVNAGAQSDIQIAMDSLIEYDNDILEDFSKTDTLTLFYKTRGCFEYDVKKITITKDSGFVARIYECQHEYLPEGDLSVQNGTYIAGPLIKEVRLNKVQIEAFIRFENELEAISYRNCTTTTVYKLIDPTGYILDREDGSCQWDGYVYLEESIFGSVDR